MSETRRTVFMGATRYRCIQPMSDASAQRKEVQWKKKTASRVVSDAACPRRSEPGRKPGL